MKKPFCNKCLQDISIIEADFMKVKGFEECKKCREKKEKPVITTGVVLKK